MEALNPQKLLLLDRDGVINFDSDAYIKSPDEWHAIPGSLETIAKLNAVNVDIIVITNQSGIGRGLFTESTLDAIHKKMCQELALLGGSIKDIFFCPHTPADACNCRKPEPGLLEALEKKYDTCLKNVPFVGDSQKDLGLAYKKECLPVLVKTGKGYDYFKHQFSSDPWQSSSLVFNSLEVAGNHLIKHHFNG